MGQGESIPKPVIELRGDNPVYRKEAVREMIKNGPAKGDTKVFVICISGVYRSGKSFLLNLLKTYLDYYSEHGTDSGWTASHGIKIRGGNWALGQHSVTHGIWMYMYPNLVDNRAIILMDCQGNKGIMTSTPTLDNLILFLGLQLADVHILNVTKMLGADDLDRLGLCIYHADDDSDGSIFERQMFLIRDWQNIQEPQQLDELIGLTSSSSVKDAIVGILHAFKAVEVTSLAYPGASAAGGSESSGIVLGDLNPKFTQQAGELFNKLIVRLSPEARMNGQEFLSLFEFVSARAVGKISSPQEAYEESLIKRSFDECSTHFTVQVEKAVKSQLTTHQKEAEVTVIYEETVANFLNQERVQKCVNQYIVNDYLDYFKRTFKGIITLIRQTVEQERLDAKPKQLVKYEGPTKGNLKSIESKGERLKQKEENWQFSPEQRVADRKERLNNEPTRPEEEQPSTRPKVRMESSETNPGNLEMAEVVKKIQMSSFEAEGGKEPCADDMDSQIIDLLDTNGVLCYQVMHSPDNAKEIEIVGNGVERLGAKLLPVVSSKGYTLVMKDVEFSPVSNREPLIANWIKLCSGIRATGYFALKIPNNDNHISVIDAIMQGKDRKRRRCQIEYFGMTTAHSFLTEEQNEKLRASTRDFKHVQNEVIVQADEEDFYMSVQEGADIDITGPPRFLYHYWKPKHVFGKWEVMQDIAFFKLDNDNIRSDDLVPSTNYDVNQVEHQRSFIEEAYIVNIHSLEALRELDGSRIRCKGKLGRLIREPTICNTGFTIGTHLAFVLDGDRNEWLKEGDCGSFLRLEEKHNGRVPILGMFIGQLKSSNRIHQAVILSWNIRQVEATPRLKISDIDLAEDSIDF